MANDQQIEQRIRMTASFLGNEVINSFRLYDKRVAETILFLGRTITKWIKEKIEEQGYTVIGADTDSNFIKLDINEKDIVKKGKEIISFINNKTY